MRDDRLYAVRLTGLWKLALAGLLGAAATGVPPVDSYQIYVRNQVTNCSDANFAEQPGVVEFKDMMVTRMGGANWGIFACSGYEHEEGRAWDWRMNAYDPAEALTVHLVIDWLLANEHEMARRLGLAYLIWNDQYISFSLGQTHLWEDYLACNPAVSSAGVCHTNHVHFAFSWAGALRQTSWFTTDPRPEAWYPQQLASAGLRGPARR